MNAVTAFFFWILVTLGAPVCGAGGAGMGIGQTCADMSGSAPGLDLPEFEEHTGGVRQISNGL